MTWNDMPGHWYDDYERGRPGYPHQVLDAVDVPPTATVLELAPGTGKLTRLLVSRYARVIGVEPDANMRRMLATHCPEAESAEGSAEQIPLADASVDAVFAAQAFHWFDNDRALAEMARVLKKGGAVAALWNVPIGQISPPITAVEELLARHWPDDYPFPLDMCHADWAPSAWRLASAPTAFADVHELQLPNPQIVGPEGLVAFFGSMGWIADLPDPERVQLLGQARSLLTAGTYELPWETRVHWTRSTGSAQA